MKYLHTMRLWLVCLLLRGTRARDVLKVMDEWSKTAKYPEAIDMWNILTGLRGPDDDSMGIKRRTTARIRARTVPNMAVFAEINGDGREIVGWVDDHFGQHVMAAAESIHRQGL